MTAESNGTGAAPADAWFADYVAREAARSAAAAALRPANKAALFGALAAAGIEIVTVDFDGYGDSGQIEGIDARDAHGDVALPDMEVELARPADNAVDVDRHRLTVRETIERLCYDLLEDAHGGWENNEGAFGDFVFDVPTRAIRLSYNERYETSELFEHEW